MEAVSLKFEEGFLKNMTSAMKRHNYSTKTEFIREAIRDKLIDLEKRDSMVRALKLYGAGKNKHGPISPTHLHAARERVAKELAQELGTDSE